MNIKKPTLPPREGYVEDEINGVRVYVETSAHKKQRESDEKTLTNVTNVSSVASIVFVSLAEEGNLDDVTAMEHIDQFAEWEQPINYKINNIRSYKEKLYRCISGHTSQADWTPDVAVSLWVKIGDPTVEYPEWSQPIGSQDAYAKGDKVTHDGKHWISDVGNNVWEPGVYGWSEVLD